MRNFLITVGAIFLLIVVTVAISLGFYVLCSWADNINYNDGICTECGEGHWVYSQAVGGRRVTRYIYFCDNCGSSLETVTFKK